MHPASPWSVAALPVRAPLIGPRLAAALNGNEACVALLLQRGADADLQDVRVVDWAAHAART